jgi:hypothetical protein
MFSIHFVGYTNSGWVKRPKKTVAYFMLKQLKKAKHYLESMYSIKKKDPFMKDLYIIWN